MNFKLKDSGTVFIIFYFISAVLFLVFVSMRNKFPFLTIERAVYATIAYIQFALLGIVILVKPHLPIKAFIPEEKEIRPKDYWMQRIIGIAWILISITSIIDAWKYTR